jgi:pimeloyl-ACP methyl ester carboxylesterase
VQLAARRFGEAGRPLVILHGLFGSARNWSTVARALSRRAQVHALDLRNHGRSPWTAAMDYPDLVGDLVDYLDREGLDRPVVLGHSLGGKTAMLAALAHPGRIGALVVVDIAPAAYRESLLDHVEAVADLQLDGAMSRGEIDEDLSGLIPEPGVRGFILQNLVQTGGRFSWRINLAALRAHATALTDFRPPAGARYDGPTLFVAGAASGYLAPPRRKAIAPLFPAAALETVPGAGHEVHAENPGGFLSVVERFLDRLEPPPGNPSR